MSRLIVFSLTIFISFTLLLSCTNDNKGYREYYHPMGNNPVQVVPWLKKVKKSFYGNEGRISLYQWNGKHYYTAQVFHEMGTLPVSPFTIYETDDDEEIIVFHTEDALASEQDPMYISFIENGDLIYVLWSNEKKYSSVK